MLYGLACIIFFSVINALVWGDDGYTVGLLIKDVPAFSLVWFWIALISIMYGANYSVDGKSRHSVCHIIATWWVANIGVTTILNAISYRGIEMSENYLGMSNLVLDFVAQSGLDLVALCVIWLAVKWGLAVSVWLLIFCLYLLGNIFGNAVGAYGLMYVEPNTVAEWYDSYMYTTFTVMLLIQAAGSWTDAILRWWGSNVDLFADIRPALRNLYGCTQHHH